MDAQLALPFREGRKHCTIYLNLTRDDVELIELGRQSAENFLIEHGYGNFEECIVDAIFPLLDAIIAEAKKEMP